MVMDVMVMTMVMTMVMLMMVVMITMVGFVFSPGQRRVCGV